MKIYHNSILLLFLALPSVILALPYTIEMGLYAKVGNLYFQLVYLPYYIFIIPFIYNIDVNNRIDICIIFIMLMQLISCLFSHDNKIIRALISMQFFYPYFILKFINIQNKDLKFIKNIVAGTYIIIVIQVLFFSFGIMESHTQVIYEFGNFIRSGTTAGASTTTGHILLALAIILCSLTDSDPVRAILLVFNLMIEILTFTRSSIFANALIALYMLIQIKQKKQKYELFIVLLILLIIINNYFGLLSALSSRSIQISMETGDWSSGRIQRISESFVYIKNNCIYSLFGFGGAITPYFKELNSNIISYLSPHNLYISFLVEHGLITTGLFIILLYFLNYGLEQKPARVMFVITYLIFNFNTELIFRSFEYAFFFWLFIFIQKVAILDEASAYKIQQNSSNASLNRLWLQ